MLRYIGKDSCSIACDGRKSKTGQVSMGGGWNIHRMQYCTERAKCGFIDTPKKSPPQYNELKKKKEENSGTEYVQCEPIFINRIHQQILRRIHLTGTGEIVRGFFFYFSLLSVLFEFFTNTYRFWNWEKHMRACLFQTYSKSQKDRRNKGKHVHTRPCPHLPTS